MKTSVASRSANLPFLIVIGLVIGLLLGFLMNHFAAGLLAGLPLAFLGAIVYRAVKR